MATTYDRDGSGRLPVQSEKFRRLPAMMHPLHAILLGFPVPLFLGALLSDLAYASSYEVQWTNFASWLIAGALVAGGFLLLWALIDLLRAGTGPRRGPMIYFLVVLAMWVLAFINALVHAMDAWAKMPSAVILSVIVFLLACAAAWIGFSSASRGELR